MSREEFSTEAEYVALCHQRTEVFGYGMQVGMRTCCPFCCHPGVCEWRIMTMEEDMKKGFNCPSCQRGMAIIVTTTAHGKTLEFIQTAGPDIDPTTPWIPAMRRA